MSLEERSGSTCSRYSAGTRLSLQNLAKVQHGEHRLQKLPNEVWAKVLSKLSTKELLDARLVSKSF
ncbi:hypothetical protein WJX84_009135, partial [Apatococcus fuscideae]